MKHAGPRALFVALAAGLAGAGAATLAGIPAGALLGSTVAVTGAAVARLGPAIPGPLRNTAFLVIGATLGAGVTPHFLSDIAKWPLSLALLTATVAGVMAVAGWILCRFFRLDAATAALATSPGALAYSLSLASAGAGDVRAVTVLQSLRLLIITLFLPPAIALTGDGSAAISAQNVPTYSYATGITLLAAGFAAGAAGQRLGLPAAYMLAGLAVSGGAHAAGIVDGRLPVPLTFLGLAVTGAVIGARFSGVTRGELVRLSGAGLVAAASAVAISAAASLLVARLLHLPFGQVWVSFAPGGVEAMSSMALALGHDPVFVATHHVFRLVLLFAVLPVLVRLAKRR